MYKSILPMSKRQNFFYDKGHNCRKNLGKETDNMKLDQQGLLNRSWWKEAGYDIPEYDRGQMKERTKENPYWIHFGAGNIFRAFLAHAVQKLLNKGLLDRGLIVAAGYNYEIIDRVYHAHDDYTILVTLKADGSIEKTVIGSIAESLTLDTDNSMDFRRLKSIFEKDSLQMASFTITEKGYCLCNEKGERSLDVADDFRSGPGKPNSYIGKIAALLYTRFQSGEKPIALVSMDNCSRNGEKLQQAVNEYAVEWTERGLAAPGFLEYINNPAKVSFPWTMIDKITPRSDVSIGRLLEKDGVEEMVPFAMSMHSYAAPFVNAEESGYLVIEDCFPNGRARLEGEGIYFARRATVEKSERMKVCTCLNPLHTALAVFGSLLGYDRISEEMKDRELHNLICDIGYREGLPAAEHPGIINPVEFLDSVINIRFPNPFMPDTPQRIATDTSQKLAVRFGETIKAYMESDTLNIRDLKSIPLVFAGWLRYLAGGDDCGQPFQLSPDPLLDMLQDRISGLYLGKRLGAEEEERLKTLLEDDKIFGVNLYEAGMAEKVIEYYKEMMEGPGAVRGVLKKMRQHMGMR